MPQDFHIEYDNIRRSYFPGQNVTGRVIFALLEDKSTQGLKIKLEGRAKVRFSNKGCTTSSVNYDAYDHLVDLKMYALGDGDSTINLPAGQYDCPFNFQLPNKLPSSYISVNGKVFYQIEATIKRFLKIDHVANKLFCVNTIVDLNKNPELDVPCEHRKEKNFCCLCCSNGPVGFLIQLPTLGYVPGQHVTPLIEIYNRSSRTIKDVSFELIQSASFFAQGRSKFVTKTVASTNRGPIGPGVTDIWQGKILQIPSVPPTELGGCDAIDIQYYFLLQAHCSKITSNLKKAIPIKIGTIPFTSTVPQTEQAPSTVTEPLPSSDSWMVEQGTPSPVPSEPPEYTQVYNPPGDTKTDDTSQCPISYPTNTDIYNPPGMKNIDASSYLTGPSGQTEIYIPPGEDMKSSYTYTSSVSSPTEIYVPPGDNRDPSKL